MRYRRGVGGVSQDSLEWLTRAPTAGCPVLRPSLPARTLVTFDPDDITSYDYDLPPELIAAEPPTHREDARLLVIDRNTGTLAHGNIRDLPELLSPGDRLVLNDTRVVPARLRGVREATGGKWEGLFLRTFPGGDWELLGQTRGRLGDGESVLIGPPPSEKLRLTLIARGDGGVWRARPDSDRPAFDLLERFGEVPLPPYIRRGVAQSSDIERYQTVFARTRGSIAAPTAGLHFTDALLERCQARGIEKSFVTLHVGIGTFRPMTADRLSEHVMHSEWGELSVESAAAIAATKAVGGRIVAVGTTSVRVLESAARHEPLTEFRGETDLFIRPPYKFQTVDALLTNFHLPRSTLLALVSAFATPELIRQAYAEAIEQRYRFFSYGDAMLIL
ncbi:MAG: tRNA preQ1(34) S-adenosylmethionine ribosyltransferase-isomerase QueA [Planctomycetaceae bacterium]|nr:tRNA preQ1(34) S-adenosylmethionine ribosyltransferase-isomerase QueA [Planctomycetaceae bacterium]